MLRISGSMASGAASAMVSRTVRVGSRSCRSGPVVGDLDVVAKFPIPGVQAFLTGDQPDEGGLPGPVRPHERQALAALHDQVHVAEDLVGSEGLGNGGERHENPPGTRGMR